MKSLRVRGQIAMGVFAVMIVVAGAAALSDLSLAYYLQGISAGEPPDEKLAEAIDSRRAIGGFAQLACIVVCVIVFLMWFHRAHKNLAAAGLRGLRYTPGWAVGGWFVPFLNLVRPFQVMQEVWAGSAHLARGDEGRVLRATPTSPHVGSWWAMFLISSFASNMSAKMMLRADELDELIAASWVTLASDLLDVPALLLALLLVGRVTGFQERARMRETSAGDVGPIQSDWPSVSDKP